MSPPVCSARPFTDPSLSPRFRTVSIIPGIENFAPDRTETSSGSLGSPSDLPMASSSAAEVLARFFKHLGGSAALRQEG